MMKESYLQLNLTKPASLKASAGTGKTYSLIRLTILYLLQKENPPTLSQILLVTFTNKATAELRQRLRDLFKLLIDQHDPQPFNDFIKEHKPFLLAQGYQLPQDHPLIQEKIIQAYEDLDDVAIFTIHSFCQHLLRSYPFESKQNFSFTLANHQDILIEVIHDFFRQYETKMPNRLYIAYLSYIRGYETLRTNDFEELIFGATSIGKQKHRDDSLLTILQEELTLNAIKPNPTTQDHYWSLYEAFAEEKLSLNATIQKLLTLPYDPGYHHLWQNLHHQPEAQVNLFLLLDLLIKYLPKKLNPPTQTHQNSPLSTTWSEWITYLLHQLAELNLLDVAKFTSTNKTNLRGLSAFFNAMKAYLVSQIATYVQNHHHRQRQEQAQMRFNDLIDDLYHLLQDQQEAQPFIQVVRKTFRVALIDEFQDTDHKQWHIFHTLFQPTPHETAYHSYLLIGDPKQSIYRFRGANLAVYAQAMQSIDPDNIANLKNNFRSNAPLIEAINQIFTPLFNEDNVEKYEAINAQKKDALILRKDSVVCEYALSFLTLEIDTILTSKDSINNHANMLTTKSILDLLQPDSPYDLWNPDTKEARRILPSDIACLVNTNQDADTLKDLLKSYHLPAINITTMTISESQEFAFVILLFEAIMAKSQDHPSIKYLYYHIYLEPFRSMQNHTYYDFLEQFYLIRNCMIDNGAIITLQYMLDLFAITITQLQNIASGERFFVNMRHIQDILLQLAKEYSLHDTKQILQALRNLKSLNEDEGKSDKSLRLEHDEDAIQILTAHKSKGLEYPLVFSFVAIQEPRDIPTYKALPFMHQDGGKSYHFHPQEADKDRELSIALAEMKRLFYVASTRAQSHLYIPLLPSKSKTPLHQFLLQVLHKEIHNLDQSDKKQAEKDKKRSLFLTKYLNSYSTSITVKSYTQDDLMEEESFTPKQLKEKYHFTLHTSKVDAYSRILPTQSYSSLSRGKSHPVSFDPREEESDENDLLFDEEPLTITPRTIKGGAALGSLLHKMFEEIDFSLAQSSLQEFIRNQEIHQQIHTMALGFFTIPWMEANLPALKELFWQTLQQTLEPVIPISLCQLPLTKKKRHELSFHIYLQKDLTFVLAGEEYHLQAGFLTGFIDLVFEYQDKLYILDWKSSQLGQNIEDYTQERMHQEMINQHFIVQYHLYILATMHYAKFFNPAFSYDDIGGIYYLFCRGINQQNHNGIYFNKPSQQEFKIFLDFFKEAIITLDS